MRLLRETIPAILGFDPSAPQDRASFAPALGLSLAFVALPFCLLLPLDVDRTLPLLFVPAVWLGARLHQPSPPYLQWLVAWALGAMLISTLFAAYPARSLVMASAVSWVLAGGMTARKLALSLPAVRVVLGGISLGAASGALLVACGAGLGHMDFPVYWGARIFGMHQFAGALAALSLLRLAPPQHWSKIQAALLALLNLAALGTASSRAGLVGLAVVFALGFWRGTPADRRFLLRFAAPLAGGALLIAYWIGQPFFGMGLASALHRTAAATSLEAVSSARSYFWSVVWQQAWNSPWIGHGADAYQYIQPRLHGAQPHNFILQWFYEYGIIGSLPLGILLLAVIAKCFRLKSTSGGKTQPLQLLTSVAVAAAAAFGLFDGVFYHMVIFMPVTVLGGFALGKTTVPASANRPGFLHRLLHPALLVALLALLLHSWLGLMLLRAQNVEPADPAARILRAFPSTTFGLDNWINRWKRTDPAIVIDWTTWAQTHSNQQPEYHLAAVQIYLERRDFVSAERELRACLPKVRDVEVGDIERLLEGISAKAREQAAALADPSTK